MREVKKYDSNGNIIENECYISDGELFSQKSYQYDSTKNIIVKNKDSDTPIENLSVIPDNKTAYKKLYKYDSAKNKVEEITYLNDKLYRKTDYKYNSDGNLIEETSISEECCDYKCFYTYDIDGNRIAVAKYNSEGDLQYKKRIELSHDRTIIWKTDKGIELKFETDTKNNWTKIIKYVNNVPTYIETREIEYFN